MKCQTRDFLVILCCLIYQFSLLCRKIVLQVLKIYLCSSLNVELYKGYNSKNKIDRKRILMNISLRISLAYDIHVWKRKNLKEWRRIVDYDVCNKIIIVFFLFN